ncbi:MAG: hypothetical protein GWN93_24800 [Deltaproteobacteria bacterium]|jgi:hypothetical protein|nr:hypothetical protein [Deltaproteobacteria bacterium]
MKIPKWLIVVALVLGGLMWWHQEGNMPDFVPDWLRITTPVTSPDATEYSLIGGFPAAATRAVFKKLAALSHGEKLETIEELKGQGLVWETLDGQRVRILSRKRGSKVVEVQDIGSSDSYWTYVDALGK